MSQAQLNFPREFAPFLGNGDAPLVVRAVFKGSPAAKHLIEAQGIPHTEVLHIQVNGCVRNLTYHVQDGDQIEVVPWVWSDGGEEDMPSEASQAVFIVDNHLGKLATYLRILGFDTLYDPQRDDAELAEVSDRESRILLTRDRQLLMRRIVTQGYWVHSKEPHEQIVEVIRRYRLENEIRPFHRCLRCNGLLNSVDKTTILHRLEPMTRRYYDDFRICPVCDQIYWPGSHYAHMQGLVKQVQESCQ